MIPGNLILDIVLLVLLAIGLSSGWKRGLIGMVLKGGATLISGIITFSFFRKLGVFIKERFLYTKFYNMIEEPLKDTVPTADGILEKVPEPLRQAADLFGVELGEMAESAAENGNNAVTVFAETVADKISGFLGAAIAFLALFIVSYILFRVFSKPLSKIVMKIPLVGKINRILGLVLAFLVTFLISWIVVQLLVVLDSAIDLSFFDIEKTWIAKIYHNIFSLVDLVGGK